MSSPGIKPTLVEDEWSHHPAPPLLSVYNNLVAVCFIHWIATYPPAKVICSVNNSISTTLYSHGINIIINIIHVLHIFIISAFSGKSDVA